MLLHEMGRHEDAIGTLEQAIERYPQDPQRLLSQYLIGESYRRWAQELLDRAPQIRTESERNKNQQISAERLNTALSHFEEVQRTITLKTHDIHSDPLMGSHAPQLLHARRHRAVRSAAIQRGNRGVFECGIVVSR